MNSEHHPEFDYFWTKETVEKILEEYQASNLEFICHASQTFEHLYSIFQSNIRQLALDWNPLSFNHDSTEVLFSNNSRSIRLAFLRHCLTLLK
jgi:hypothetical protein